MKKLLSGGLGLAALLLAHGPAAALLIETSAAALGPQGVFTLAQGQNLENELNSNIFNPLGMEIEFAAPTGGTFAVDDLTFEGPGLTVITGSGFILRFGTAVSEVRMRFGNFKDDENRTLYAFEQDVDYTRSTTLFSQSANGNVTASPSGLATQSVSGVVPAGAPGYLDLTVSDPGNIEAVMVLTNKFLWTLEEIEFEFASVPEPATLGLFGFGLAGLGLAARRRRSR